MLGWERRGWDAARIAARLGMLLWLLLVAVDDCSAIVGALDDAIELNKYGGWYRAGFKL